MRQYENSTEDETAEFPSSSENFGLEEPMDLNAQLVHRPAATYFVRVSGDSMIDAGIQSGDILAWTKVLKRVTTPSSSPNWMESS